MYSIRKYGKSKKDTAYKQPTASELAVMISDYLSAKEADRHAKQRYIRNMKVTGSLDYDAWRDVDALAMLDEGREPKAYNVCQKYVHGIAGNYILNSFDPKYVDREDDKRDNTSTCYKFNRIYYADKEHNNFNYSRNICIRDGVISVGVEELIIIRTNDDPRPRIGFVPLRRDQCIFDPDVLSSKLTRDAKRFWKEFYISAEEMMNYYPWATPEVLRTLQAQANLEKRGTQYEETNLGILDLDKATLSGKHLTVEYYHVEMEPREVVKDLMTDTILPETEYENGTQEDFFAKQQWAASQGIVLTDDNLVVVESIVPVLYLTVFVPSLGICLDNRIDERQLNGKIPFYAWAYMMLQGQAIGVVDFAYPAQDDINKREAAKTKFLTQFPMAKAWIHEALFPGNPQKTQDEARSFNDMSKALVIPEDTPPELTSSLFGVMSGNAFPAQLFNNEVVFKVNLLNDLVNFNVALQGETARSGESGVHYGKKIMEGLVNHRLPMENLVQHEKDKAEDWLRMAIQLYGGRTKAEKVMNYNRQFYTSDGEDISVNNFKGVDENGNDIVENDVTELRRVDVIITQTKENDFQKQAKSEVNTMMLQAIRPSDSNGVFIAAILDDEARSRTYEDEEQKKKVVEAADIYYQNEMLKAQLSMLNTTMQIQQLQMQAQQMAMGGMAPPEAGGGTGNTQEPVQPQGLGGNEMRAPVDELNERIKLQNQQGVQNRQMPAR